MMPEDAEAPPDPPVDPIDPIEALPEEAVPVAESAVLPLPAPPAIADGVLHPLDPRHLRMRRIVSVIAHVLLVLALLGGLGIVFAAAPLQGWAKGALGVIWIGTALFFLWLSWRWPAVEHRHSAYKVDDRGIEIRRGVVWRQVIHVPLSRVQHTDVSQGPLERTHGLGTLVIYTAGTDHAKVDLRGLSHQTALAIRDHLLSGSGGGDAV